MKAEFFCPYCERKLRIEKFGRRWTIFCQNHNAAICFSSGKNKHELIEKWKRSPEYEG